MFFVYALRSEIDGWVYVGFSADLLKRLKEHNAGKTKSTKGYRPWEIINKKMSKPRLKLEHEKYTLNQVLEKNF